MKFTLNFLIVSLIWSPLLVLGFPVRSSTDDIEGAAYFITNDPSGNFVLSADIHSDGSLVFRAAVTADGRGAHGVSNPIGPDALFSQGAVKASAAGNILATVNAGSNSITVFAIDPDQPSNLTKLGQPVSSEGEFPMSLAINSNGTQVCVLNGGQVAGVSCFAVDKDLGLVSGRNALRSLPLNQTTPATGPAGSASHVIFSEDGSQLIASIKGTPPTPGYLAIWDVAEDGTLSQDFAAVPPPSGGLLPFSMTAVPGKDALLVTDPNIGFDIIDISQGQNSSASSAVPISGQSATCWSSFSHTTGNFYLTDVGTSIVTEVNVDENLKGTVVNQYPQQNMSGTIDNDIATIGGKDFMYVLGANASLIEVLALNGPGNATNFKSFDIAGPFKSAGLAIDGVNLQGMTIFLKNAR
jgi:hypothetical protein